MLTGLCSVGGSVVFLWDQWQTRGQGDAKSAQREKQGEWGEAALALITGKVKQK